MAFTQKEVEEAFSDAGAQIIGFGVQVWKFNESTIYEPLMDFLTGKTRSLPRLQVDLNAYGIPQVLNLLKDIERPSANNHLVLQVIHHPDLAQMTNYFYSNWLNQYLVTHPGKVVLQAVIKELKTMGKKDDEIFAHFIASFVFPGDSDFNNENTYLKDYLNDYIRTSKQLINPRAGYRGYDDDWSSIYFKMLEEVRPEFATEYALQGIYARRNNPIIFFTDYRKGKYMPLLLEFLQNRQNPNLETIQSKFDAALYLYDHSQKQYEAIAVELSMQYLEYTRVHLTKEQWEPGFYLQEFKDTALSNLHYSSCAFHILFKTGSNKALDILTANFKNKAVVQIQTLQVVQHHLGKDAFSYFEMAIMVDSGGIEHNRKLINLLQTDFEPSQYLPLVWKLASNKSRPLKELVAKIVAEQDPAAEAKAIELLENKSADVRQTAALVLTQFPSATAYEAIMKILKKESNDNARDILLQAVAGSLPAVANENFINEMVDAAKERGKLNKPVEAWLDESLLPSLYEKEGKVMSNERVRFLLYRMSRVKDMRSDIEAKYIIQLAEKEKSAPFAMELIKMYIDKEAKPEHKYLVALAALLGNDSVVDKIRTTINKWIDENRYKMAEYGVGALAIQGSDKALRWVEWYSRKYKSKKANVGAAALAALETAAEELGITTHELGDRVVPDFGFDGLFKNFTVDGDEYRAFIDSNFKIAFFNENNKKLKSLPAAAGAELKEEFKAIGKEVRDIVRSQSSRLEYYLIIQRRWNYEQWQKFFLQNPVMFIYATKLLWGTYDQAGKLQQTFLCTEDTSLIDVNNDEVSIDTANFIGIVHPSQPDAALLQQWKKQFFDLSIESIFPQLERRIPDMMDIDLSKAIITKFNEKQTATGSIRSTLERYGWHRGHTGDGGMVESFNLLYGKMEAMLEVEGVGAGYGWGGDEKTGRLYVIDKSKHTRPWFNQPQNDNDERLIKLKDIPPIFLAEMLAAVELIKAKES